MDCSPPGSSVQEILQARILEQVAISSSRGSSPPRDWTGISCIGRQILNHWATREAPYLYVQLHEWYSMQRIFLERLLWFSAGKGNPGGWRSVDRETSHRVDIWLWILKLLHVLFSVKAIRLANIRMYTHTYTHAHIYFLYMCLCINHIFNREICLLGSMNSWEFESSSSLERGVPGGAVVDSACQCRRCRRLRFDPWVGKIPWRTWQCTPVLWPGKFCGQRRLAGYSPRGRKELDTVEHTHTLEKSYARIYKNLKVYRLLEIFVEFMKP